MDRSGGVSLVVVEGCIWMMPIEPHLFPHIVLRLFRCEFLDVLSLYFSEMHNGVRVVVVAVLCPGDLADTCPCKLHQTCALFISSKKDCGVGGPAMCLTL